MSRTLLRWSVVLIWCAGCTTWMGLEELESLPPAFPLTAVGETGRVARSDRGGQLSVDFAFDDEAGAQAGRAQLLEEAASQGFSPSAEGSRKKWDYVELKGDKGRIELGCCPARADRRRLVLVSWWPEG